MVELIEGEILHRKTEVTWDDIAGLEFAKKTIYELLVWPLLNPDLFVGFRAISKGALLFGPPGTGKTMIGKAIAAQSNATFFNISSSALTSKWVGEGEKMVKTLFKMAEIHQPSVVFIDEIDSLLCGRNENDIESSRRLKTEFMVQLCGAHTQETDRILFIGATNRPEELDEAVKRRLEKRLYIPLPNSIGRSQFLRQMLKKERENGHKIDLGEVDIQELTDLTKGYSGADLSSLSRDAAFFPIRNAPDITKVTKETLRPVTLDDFKEALKCVKATVHPDDVGKYIEWNKKFGSYQFNLEELDN